MRDSIGAYLAESHIVWLAPPDPYAYLREAVLLCRQRDRFSLRRCPRWRVIAYAVLQADTPRPKTGYFSRRVWWVCGKRDPFPEGHWPCEAVLPGSIQAGQPSVALSEGRTAASVS